MEKTKSLLRGIEKTLVICSFHLLMEKTAQALFLETVPLSRSDQENVLLRPFAVHLTTPMPDGVLGKFIPWHLTMNPSKAFDWMIGDGGHTGLVRYMRDGMFPIEPEITFAKWRAVLEKGPPVIAYWSFIACYVNDEGVRNMVKASWGWKGDVGEQVYKCVSDYIIEMYSTLTKSPFDEKSNALTILVGLYAVMKKNLGSFDLRAMILGGTLKPVAVPLSRNACRERDRDRRQNESLRKEQEMARIAAENARAAIEEEVVEEAGEVEEAEEEYFDDDAMDD